MGHDHSHAHAAHGNERALWWSLLLTTTFLIVEVVGGILTGSLALISDAAHMFTDTAALAIALAAIRVGKRPADAKRTFGYYRFEILAAALNAILLFIVALYIIWEAYQRWKNPTEIESLGMLVIATIGLGVNLISMRLLSSGKDSSLNVKGAYLEVWSDMLGSIGVIAGALIIYFTRWSWVDSLIAVAIGLWVLPRTWKLLKESLNILLEGVPQGLKLAEIETAILEVPGVSAIHDLHVWAITSGKVSLTAHVVVDRPEGEVSSLLDGLRRMLVERFEIHHSTMQLETTPCSQSDGVHTFESPHATQPPTSSH